MLEIILVLIMTHITILCVTIYLHRNQAHRSVQLHPALAHFMRFWLWLTTGMVTREWVAVHRLHHQKCERPGDPHSPHVHGIWQVLFGGALLYRKSTQDTEMIEKLSHGTPSDWLEKNVYSKYNLFGILFLLLLEVAIFGWAGLLMWLVQMAWIPFWAAGVVNGLGHWWGYRNTSTKDKSTNLIPWGVWIGGEELHNNHHADPTSAKLSLKWWEFDIGWFWIKIFEKLGLAKLKTK